jgi:hypothetical protein
MKNNNNKGPGSRYVRVGFQLNWRASLRRCMPRYIKPLCPFVAAIASIVDLSTLAPAVAVEMSGDLPQLTLEHFFGIADA